MKIVLMCFLLVLSVLGNSQTVQFNFGGQISNYETGKKESGVTVSVTSKGMKVASSMTASNGKYLVKFDLPATATYDITFSKAGFVSKTVSFDFSKLNTERIKEGEKLTPLTDLSLEIFTVKPGIDFSFLEKDPVAKFNADSKSSNLALDVASSQRVKQKIEGLLENAEAKTDDSDLKYNAAMQEGEKLFKDGKLGDALKQFEAAAFLKPKEFQPQKRIADIDALLRAKKEETAAISEVDQQYNNYIAAADNFRDKKQYTEALSKYRAAMRVKNEQYPKDEVAKIEKIMNESASAERVNREYKEAVAAGDAAMSAKQYSDAIKHFTTATGLKPDEAHPKTELEKAKKIIEDLAKAKEKQTNYDAAMKEAGNLFAGSKFEEAKAKYLEASEIFPNEANPKERITLCDQQLAKLAASQQLEKEIEALFLTGQAAIEKKEYTEAKGVYKKILGLDPKRNLAQVKLDEIDRLIKADQDEKNKEERFASYIKQGDASVTKEDFAMAKQHYGAALEVKEDKTVQEKYDAVLAKLANQEAKALVASKYEQVMAEAKKLLDAGDLEKARLKFQNAASIDDAQTEPKTRIDEIDARLNKKSGEDKKYRELIDKGDALVVERKYLEAIKMFDGASEMRPAEKEPKEKSAEAARLSRESEEDADRLFEKMIEAARQNIEEADYEKAKDLANRAITNRPAEKRPEDRRPENMLKEIEGLEKTEKAFNEFMASAEQESESKNYKQAINLYKQAAELRPKDPLPPKRIQELNTLLNDALGQAELEKKYQENFSKGVSEVGTKNYKMALESFKKAQTFKPDDQAVQDKISEVQQIIDEKEKALANVEERKLTVDRLVKEANTLFEKRDWSQAKIKYTEVVDLDPGQPFSVARIVECDAQLQLEKGKLADAEYKALIADGDNNFEKKDFLRSKELFEKATSIRPTDNYPIKKLAELERLLNPTIVQTSSLEPLGDVYTGDNAELDLAKADISRKNKKSDEFLKTKNSAILQNEEQNAKLQKRQYSAQADLNTIESKTAEESAQASERAQGNTEQVKTIQYKAAQVNRENEAFNKAKNTANQEKLNYVQEDIQLEKEKAERNIELNAQQVQSQTSELVVQEYDRSMTYKKANINTGQQLSQVSVEAQTTVNDDASRRLTEAQLKVMKENAISESTGLAEKQQLNAEKNEEQFSHLGDLNEKRAEDYKQKMQESSDGLRAIEMNQLEKANEAYDREMEKYLKTKDVVNGQVKVIDRKEAENNANLRVDQAKLDRIKTQLSDDMAKRAEVDKGKEVDVQSSLDYVILNEAEKRVEDSKKQNQNAAVLKEVHSSSDAINTQLAANKQDQNYSSQSSINQVKVAGEVASTASVEKQMKNASAVDDMYALESIRNKDLADKAVESQRATTDKINDAATAEPAEKAKNQLGMDFPEGVTEEKFSQSGSDGTIHTIITRRVVVIDGHGDVYLRSQRNGVSTYKKNNDPITEYIWQKETQGSSLVRH